jgi:hypothetical protein
VCPITPGRYTIMIVRMGVGLMSCLLAALAVLVCYSPAAMELVDAQVGVNRFCLLAFGWSGVHLLTFRECYRAAFVR